MSVDPVDQLADVAAPESGRCRKSRRRPFPASRPRPRGPRRPRLIVQRTSPLIVSAASARTRSRLSATTSAPRNLITSPRMPRSDTSTFEPPPSTLTGTPASLRQSRGRAKLLGPVQRQEPVRGAAHLESRQRRERGVPLHALAERFVQFQIEVARARHRGRPVRRRSCAGARRSPLPACTPTNSTQSPGASWPASGRSAVMTVAIFG